MARTRPADPEPEPQRPRIASADSLPWPEECRCGLSDADTELWLAQQRLARASQQPPIFAVAVAVTTGVIALLLWGGAVATAPRPVAVARLPVATAAKPIRVPSPLRPPAFSARPAGPAFSRPNPL